MLLIRPARLEDAAGVAWVNTETWRTSYRGIVPDAYLDGKLGTPEHLASRTQAFREKFAAGTMHGLVVAEVAGEVVGFADGGPTRSPQLPFAGELYAIYVLNQHQRTGLGRALVRTIAANLMAQGLTSMVIWTLEASPYRAFYERLGGVRQSGPGSLELIERGGAQLPLVAYGWPDLSRLAA